MKNIHTILSLITKNVLKRGTVETLCIETKITKMRKLVVLIAICTAIGSVANAQINHIFDFDDGKKLVIGNFECEEIAIDDPCETVTLSYKAVGFSAHKFDRTIKVPAIGPRNLGENLQFYVKKLNPACGTPQRIGNMVFTVDNDTRFFISGTNGYVGVNTSQPQAQFHVQGNSYLNGNVGIGISNPTVKLDVAGIVRAHEVKVCLNQGCDYVFANDYKLMSLSDLGKFIETNKHLPDVAPAAEMEAEGINLSEMSALLLRKIEELTLYILEQDEQMKELQKRLSELEAKKGGE